MSLYNRISKHPIKIPMAIGHLLYVKNAKISQPYYALMCTHTIWVLPKRNCSTQKSYK